MQGYVMRNDLNMNVQIWHYTKLEIFINTTYWLLCILGFRVQARIDHWDELDMIENATNCQTTLVNTNM